MPFSDHNPPIFTQWQNQLDRFCKREKLPGVILSLHQEKQEPLVWAGASGVLSPEQPYFISSVAKLHLMALLVKLKVRGKVELDDAMVHILPEKEYSELSTFGEQDHTPEITLKHLLSHLSGLPDYMEYPFQGGKNLREELLAGNDQSWTFKELIKAVRKLKPLFRPGESKKAHYADTNYQLLGKVIERVTGKSLGLALEEFQNQPLGLSETYVYTDLYDRTPAPFYHAGRKLHLPRAMTSFGPAGGIVSTARDSMRFLKALFHGQLFPLSELEAIQKWIPMGPSLSYGLGIVRYEKTRYGFTGGKLPEIIGHTGISGAFAFYVPKLHLILTGTVSQSDDPMLPYKLAHKFIQTL
ncbi:serine hydrolase domain-containing protein [Cyclobacterium jeungdonense]|uniref:Serine hydrolase domain-containing protein n=1 Tax=Cyclobacterium jeungdonense TaxID=708087 RepID=A0ABT8CD79_9BACT|nr:serine hydrolase domain-containing protein [Cyclobacterium jeungdonense]MDN3690760.1 serine hydrolase domain-containing protein [Cyclobacterium jeungdonense]